MMFLKRRISQLNSKMNDIVEETIYTIKLLEVLNERSRHLISSVLNSSSPETFSELYSKVNSFLFSYKELVMRMNCNLETTVIAETYNWEINDTNNFYSNLNFYRNKNDKIVAKNSYQMNIKPSVNFKESAKNASSNPLKNKSEFKSSFNRNVDASSEFQAINDSKMISKHEEHTSNSIQKHDLAIQKEVLSTFTSSMTEFQELFNNVDLQFSEMENDKAKSVQSDEAKSVQSEEANSGISKLTITSFDKTLNFKNNIRDIKISNLPNAEYFCIMGNAISPAEFYIYFTNCESFLLLNCDNELKLLTQEFKLSKNLTNLKDYLCILKKKGISKPSKVYALFYSETDDTFHRVKVKHNSFDEVSKVDITLIDYGLTVNDVSLDELYLMPDHFYIYPAFATKCHLSDKTLIESATNSNSSDLSSKLLEIFNNWIKKNQKIIVINEDECDQFSDSLPVKIYNLSKDECLNLILKNYLEGNKIPDVEGEAGSEAGSDSFENVKGEIESWNPMKEDFNSNMNSYYIDIEDPAIAIYGYVGKDYERICNLYANRGTCFKGLSCKKEHTHMNPDGFTTDKEEIYRKAFKSLKIPEPDDVLSVTVTYVVNSTKFYCVTDKLQNDHEEESLFSLVRYMNLKHNVSKMKPLLVPPSIGQIVIGKFQEDDLWYRAKVIDVAPEKDYYNLYFVDYGNTEAVSFSNIRAIEVQYLHLPFQALHCVLHGVKSSSLPAEKSVNYFQDIIFQIVKIKIVSVLPGDNYQLVVKAYNSKNEDIANILNEKNIVPDYDNSDGGNGGGGDYDDIIISPSSGFLPG